MRAGPCAAGQPGGAVPPPGGWGALSFILEFFKTCFQNVFSFLEGGPLSSSNHLVKSSCPPPDQESPASRRRMTSCSGQRSPVPAIIPFRRRSVHRDGRSLKKILPRFARAPQRFRPRAHAAHGRSDCPPRPLEHTRSIGRCRRFYHYVDVCELSYACSLRSTIQYNS